jgi:PBSX family phage terminase large subunit
MEFQFSPKLFCPLYWHLLPLLRDPKIRYIFIEGGSSGAKTFTICQALLVDMVENEYSTMAFRRFGIDIKDSIYSAFKSAAAALEMSELFEFQQHLIKIKGTEHRIRFRGLDDEENIKGVEGFNVVYNNEWSQFMERHWDQQRKRLRGKLNQKFICDWNPISEKLWQYENWIDTFQWDELPLTMDDAPTKYSGLNPEFAFKRINKEGNAVWIKVTYRDNFWVVGHPSGKGGLIDQAVLDDFERDRITKPNFYRIYANGERGRIRTGGEFFKQFDETMHVRPLQVDKSTTIHLSVDENVNPYVTVSAWQMVEREIRQVHEIPCRTPENNAPKAALATAKWLRSIEYEDVVFVYGDPSGNKRSTIDPNNASFFDKFISVLRSEGFNVVNRVGRSAPEVALSAAFINDIYENEHAGYKIQISDKCKVSSDDYASVKEAPDGSMLKEKIKDPATGVTYEPHGHFSDAKRYFIVSILAAEFAQYKQRNRRMRSISVPG